MTTAIPISPPPLVRAGDDARFLSLVPHLAGCRPRESVVLVPLTGTRATRAMRIDLPAAGAGPGADRAVAATAVDLLSRVPHADRVSVVVYTDDPYRDEGGGIARSAFVRQVLRRARAASYGIAGALCVAADGWGSYLEPGGARTGHPLDRIRPADIGLGAGPPLGDQHAGAELPASDLAERERVGCAARDITLGLDDPTLPRVFEEVITGEGELAPRQLALLAVALDRPAIRDIALTQWSGDLREGRATQRFNVAWAAGEAPVLHGPLRLAGEGCRPDPDRLRRALHVAKRVASVAPAPLRAGSLAAAAWLSWALGSSTHAVHFARLAQQIDPDHGLADIVSTMVASQYLPPWVFDPAAT